LRGSWDVLENLPPTKVLGWTIEGDLGAAGDPPERRLDEAIDLLRSKRQSDGTWLLENTHPGAIHFALDDGDGRLSRWNTLRALRVLRWYGSW
jgi:hypothetical protein